MTAVDGTGDLSNLPPEVVHFLRGFFETTQELVYRVDEKGTLEFISPSVTRILGYRPEELVGRNVAELLTDWPENRKVLDFAEAVSNGDTEAVVLRAEVRHKSGRAVTLRVSKTVMSGADGRPRHCAIAHDITEQRNVEEVLRGKEQQFRAIFDSVQDPIFTKDLDGRYMTGNAAAARYIRRPLEDFIGKTPSEVYAPDDARRVEEEDRRVLAGEVIRTEGHLTIDGVVRTYLMTKVPLTDSGGRICGLCAVAHDLTDWKAAEARLRQSEKMEAIADLAGGIAHDFNNILTGILGHAELIKESSAAGSETRASAEVIEQATLRASRLNRQLLAFAQRGRLPEQPVDVHEVVRKAVAMIRRRAPDSVEVRTHLLADRVVVRGDAGQLEQALLNLATNSMEAMPEGGTLTFATTVCMADSRFLNAHPGAAAVPYVRVSVEDTGRGIPREHLGHLFEPFFSTKPEAHGVGLGLPLVYGCMRNHGGFVDVTSEHGRGARFDCYLPVHEPEPSEEVPPAAMTPAGGRILLVDDDDNIRDLSSQTLRRAGHTVAVAADGRSALEYYAEHSMKLDLVVLDLVMPLVSGEECLRRMREINPNVRVLVTTAYSRSATTRELLGRAAWGTLAKPYRQSELASAVAAALHERTLRDGSPEGSSEAAR